MSTGPPQTTAWHRERGGGASHRRALLSFERPRAGVPRQPISAELENCTKAKKSKRVFTPARFGVRGAHRQDSKGTRWMPWHQEPKKDVDGCDKPRLAAEQALTRGSPNGATRRR
jgi:hypothetical protein